MKKLTQLLVIMIELIDHLTALVWAVSRLSQHVMTLLH